MPVQDGQSIPKPNMPPNLLVPASEWRDVKDQISELIRVVEEHEERIKTLEEAVTPAPKPDSLQTEILKFFTQHAPMKFNTGTVAGNLGKESGKVSHRIRILARKGLLKETKEEGYSTLFWYEGEEKVSE